MTTTTRAHRPYAAKGLPSVTTLIGQLAKPALVPWAAGLAATATAEAMANGAAIDEAIAAGKAAPNNRKDRSAELGTLAHDMAARLLQGEHVDEPQEHDEHRAYRCAVAVATWVDASRSTIWHIERAMEAKVGGLLVGGTPDLVMCDRMARPVIVDIKTGKSAYDEVVVQLAAYRMMLRATVLDDDERDAYDEATGLVLHCPLPEGDAAPVVEAIAVDRDAMAAGERAFDALCALYVARKAAKLPTKTQRKKDAANE